MRRLLRSALHMPLSRWFGVIERQGRRTGRTYDTPVSCLIEDDRLLITTGDRSCANFDGGAKVKVCVRGREREGTVEAVRDAEKSLALHEHMFSKRPTFGRLAGISPSMTAS